MSFSAWRRPGWSEDLQYQTVCHSSCFLPLSQFNIFCPASCYEAGAQFDSKGVQRGEQEALHNAQLQLESGSLLSLSSGSWTFAHCLLPWLCSSTWIQGLPVPPGSVQCEQCSGSFLLPPPAGHCGIPGNETGSASRCVQAAIIAKVTFHYHPHYPSHIHRFFKQPFVCEQIDVTRQLRTMRDSIRPNLVLVKNPNQASACETHQAWSGACL